MTKGIQKQKRRRLTLREKAEVVHSLQRGDSAAAILKCFEISRRAVTKISSTRHSILEQISHEPDNLDAKTARRAKFTKIEKQLYNYIIVTRSVRKPVTTAVLRAEAFRLRDKLLPSIEDESQKARLSSFTASSGWFRRKFIIFFEELETPIPLLRTPRKEEEAVSF